MTGLQGAWAYIAADQVVSDWEGNRRQVVTWPFVSDLV